MNSSWPRKPPSKEDEAEADNLIKTVETGLTALSDGEKQGVKVVNTALTKVARNIVHTDRIRFQFEPKVKLWDYIVDVHVEFFADSQDEGMPTGKKLWSTNWINGSYGSTYNIAAKICADVVMICYIAARKLTQDMFMANRHEEMENTFYFAAFRDVIEAQTAEEPSD